MRRKIFVLTENLNFFYVLNQELKGLKIKFKILNVGIGNKIPNISCLILTTFEEVSHFKNPDPKRITFLAYSKNDDFEGYICNVLAYYRIGYVENYSELIFSIDPGRKKSGLVVFLDDYYLDSHTFYDSSALMENIEDHVKFLQKNNNNSINLVFKLGNGVIDLTIDLMEKLYNRFTSNGPIRVFLIDEYKSSKVKIRHGKRKFSKDEASALVLTMRDKSFSTKVDQENYRKLIGHKHEHKNEHKKIEDEDYSLSTFEEIACKVLSGEISLSKSIEMIKNDKI